MEKSAKSGETDTSGNLNVMMELKKENAWCGKESGRESWNYVRTFASFEMGDSKT